VAGESALLLRMFRPPAQSRVMDIPREAHIRQDPAHLQSLSLDSRLSRLRRRRRVTFLKQVVSIGPLMVGISLLLLAALGGMASFR
jgi:hypothetical protein